MNRADGDDHGAALADFSADGRLVFLAALAIVVGAIGALAAFALLHLIGLFTNLFFYQRWSTAFVSPAAHHLGVLAAFVPVAGGLVIGVMARYGSERIRGHGIPEALEAILVRGSRVEPRLALLKPISAAISIGSGGPFGAEGPIIMTGGAFGSIVAQLIHLTAAERKTLLVAGAAAGMSATFAAPIASVLLAVELLLFELKPRSLVPVALASATAMLVRVKLLGAGPIFAVPAHAAFVGAGGLAASALLGLLIGVIAWLMTSSVYASEDLFGRLRLHWMWWPALGGLVVGAGGLIYPRALGVGYDTIEALLQGTLPLRETVLLVVVKWTIWAVFLGSGTSGGVLAPLLMIGAGVGTLASPLLPYEGIGFWPLIATGAALGGTMRSPLTGMVFAVELTGDHGALLPLLVACTFAHAFTVLVMPRSILTEKVARRGYHVTREYAVDPLDVLFVRDVMRTAVVAVPAQATRASVAGLLATKLGKLEPLYPVVEDENLVGVVTRRELTHFAEEGGGNGSGEVCLSEIADVAPVTAYEDELLSEIARRMAQTGRTRLPVVTRRAPRRLLGLVTLTSLLQARKRHLEEERRRERVLQLELLVPSVFRPRPPAAPDARGNASERGNGRP